MAKIFLELFNVSCYASTDAASKTTEEKISMSSEKDFGKIFLKTNATEKPIKEFSLNLVNIDFLKKMYQPTEVNAEIQMSTSDDFASVSKSELEATFKHVKVAVSCLEDMTYSVGDDYYVHEVQVLYKSDAMFVTLKINSLDKLMTMRTASRAFVAKKLKTGILAYNIGSYKKPYTVDSKKNEKSELLYDAAHLQHLVADKKEHIFPYLVQYNESFYDFLARTANRWGEFMYYENGVLNFGYNKSVTPKSVTSYAERYYFDVYDKKNLSVPETGNYDVQASNDSQFTENELDKSPNKISGNFYCPGGKFDKVVMKKLANFFKNDKSLPTFIVNEIVDDMVDLGSKGVQRDYANDKFNSSYFPTSDTTNYSEQRNSNNDKFNQFTEIDSAYTDEKYMEILDKEQAAGKNALHINFDTEYPNLVLGQMISIDDENYIVVEVSCKKVLSEDYALEEKTVKEGEKTSTKYDLKKISTSKYVFEAVALKESTTNAKDFYPAVIPAGHVRQSEPQIATISDAKDPSGNNQVRVLFSWQTNEKEATPWLKFTTNAAGSAVVGKHYKKDKVLVGFINGNVELPYVLGGLEAKGDDVDYIQTTPGGHKLTITDDPSGASKFLTGMFLPGWGSLSAFVPQMGELPETNGETGIKLGGGFELTDNYGIYKIAGSTDGREVSVASPWGDVKINAFTGISISAPNGDISIKGKNVSIEAGNNLTLTSGTNVKKRFWDGKAENFGSNLGGEIMTAVTKKLADMFLNGLFSVDLSIVRNVFDIVFRPVEGKLLVKSNRYLMLESGKGECSYPTDAYVDNQTAQELIAKGKENDFRDGIKLQAEVTSVATQIGTLAEMLNTNFINTYNACVDAREKFVNTINNAKIWANDYDSTRKPNPVICKTFDEIKDKLWQDSNEGFSNDWLEFKDNFKTENPNDTYGMLWNYSAAHGIHLLDPHTDVEQVKKNALEFKRNIKQQIFLDGCDLRNNIRRFLNVIKGLSESEIKNKVKENVTKNVPESFIKALVPAFSKDKLGNDCFYCKDLDDNIKDVMVKYNPADFDDHLSVLKRKASVTWLEEMGFKDEWRKEMPKRDNMGNQLNVTDASGNKIAANLAVPARVFKTDDIQNANAWTDYLDSITAIPKLSPIKYKAAEALKKSAEDWLDNLNFISNIQENMSWGNAKSGGILFSSDVHTYGLGKSINTNMDTIAKEKLTDLDDHEFGVTTFLDAVRNIMKGY